MKKKVNKFPKNHPIHKRHHHVKLAVLFASKIGLALISVSIGILLGSLVKNTFTALIIAAVIAVLLYLLSILHIIDYLKLQ